MIDVIAGALQGIVAGALSSSDLGGYLSPNDVEVEVRDFGPHDHHSNVLEIVVEANQLPERFQSLDHGRERIVRALNAMLVARWGIKFWVWVRLSPGSFGEGQGL
jgi:hypothetical protein